MISSKWMIVVALLPLSLKAQVSAEDAAKANNPLANTKAFNLQNYNVPSFYSDPGLKANSLLLRYASPFDQGKVLVRVTLPLATNPAGYDSNSHALYTSGMGDLNFFATYTFSKPGAKTLLGFGPQVVIPTGTNNYTGSGKWQLGGAFIAFNASSPVLQWGSLITFQASIAGQSDRSSTCVLAIQPFGIFQLGHGTYLRSTGIASFDLHNNVYNIPLGIGLGQVMKAGGVVINIFLEPQYTFLHYGAAQPELQLFSGINFQF